MTHRRLANEHSPYLLQHADNPVDWYPWGNEAFARAEKEDKPVFLSVGYSACHWCHVMAHESFEDEATAAFLNEHFVNVKVDREERPDVDQVYQLAFQLLSQRSGGWPLSMFLTPDKRPFFGGTYFPNVKKYGMPSFRELLEALIDAWKNRRTDLIEQADALREAIQRASAGGTNQRNDVSTTLLANAAEMLFRRVDRRHGGFGRAPKFPNTMALDLMVMHAVFNASKDAREHVLRTLDGMSRGGIYDHLAGGFARYSTDEKWLIPHFEKMLYDNALLVGLYVDGSRLALDAHDEGPITHERCCTVLRETIGYLTREMTSSEGIFYSAQDADSEGEEGRYFVWTPAQLRDVLGDREGDLASAYFAVTDEGNFEHATSALSTPETLDDVASRVGVASNELRDVIARARVQLLAARETRVRPGLDDKALANWNAMTISSLVEAGATMGETAWIEAGHRALRVWMKHGMQHGRLHHAIKAGTAYGQGYLDDHAAMARAALDVFEATSDPDALMCARTLADAMVKWFWETEHEEFAHTAHDAELVLVRTRDPHDHAYPGGVGLALEVLLRLGTLLGNTRDLELAQRVMERLVARAKENPMGLSSVLRAMDHAARGPVEVIVMGSRTHARAREVEQAIRSVKLPHRVLLWTSSTEQARAWGIDPALVEHRHADPDGGPVVYVCRRTMCEAPVRARDEIVEALHRARTG